MSGGHTDRETVNQRRPLTDAMWELLRRVWHANGGRLSGHRFSTAEKNTARALLDRGYLEPDAAGWWVTTEAGRQRVQEPR